MTYDTDFWDKVAASWATPDTTVIPDVTIGESKEDIEDFIINMDSDVDVSIVDDLFSELSLGD